MTNNKYIYMSATLETRIDSITDSSCLVAGNHNFAGKLLKKVWATNSLHTTSDNYMYISLDGDIRVHGKPNVRIKLSKLIKAIYSDQDFPPEQLEVFASKWKSIYTVDTSTVEVTEDIGGIYKYPVGGSCMSDKPEKWLYIYKDIGSKVAYIKKGGMVYARALLHKVVDKEGNKYSLMDRVYYRDEKSKLTLQKWAKDNNYIRPSKTKEVPVRSALAIKQYYDGVPFVDTLKKVISLEGDYFLSTQEYEAISVDFLRETDGSSTEEIIAKPVGVYCVDTESYEDATNVYFCETDGEFYFNNTDLVWVERYGYYSADDDNIAYDEAKEEYNFTENLNYLTTDDYWTSEPVVEVTAGQYKGEVVLLDEAYTVLDKVTGEEYWLYEGDSNRL